MFGHLLDQRQFVNRLRVVGHRAVGVDRDGDRSHAEEAEGHQAEGKHRRGSQPSSAPRPMRADSSNAMRHQADAC